MASHARLLYSLWRKDASRFALTSYRSHALMLRRFTPGFARLVIRPAIAMLKAFGLTP